MIVTGLPLPAPQVQPHAAPMAAKAPDAAEPTGPAADFPPPLPPQPVWIESIPLDPIAGRPEEGTAAAMGWKGPGESLAEVDPGDPGRALTDFRAATLDDAARAPARYAAMRQIMQPGDGKGDFRPEIGSLTPTPHLPERYTPPHRSS